MMCNKLILLFIIAAVTAQPLIAQYNFDKIVLKLNDKDNLLSKNKYEKFEPADLTDSSNQSTDIIAQTDECDIFMKNRLLYKDVRIVSLLRNEIRIDKNGIRKDIDVNQINKIKFSGPSGFWTGALIGAGVSSLGLIIAGIISPGKEAFGYALIYASVSLLPAGLVGGLIGLVTAPEDELYDISGGNPKARLKRLKYLIHEHTPGLQ